MLDIWGKYKVFFKHMGPVCIQRIHRKAYNKHKANIEYCVFCSYNVIALLGRGVIKNCNEGDPRKEKRRF